MAWRLIAAVAILAATSPARAQDQYGWAHKLLAVNGQPVSDINSLRNHVAESQPGSNASVVINRDGSEKTMTVKLDEARTRSPTFRVAIAVRNSAALLTSTVRVGVNAGNVCV